MMTGAKQAADFDKQTSTRLKRDHEPKRQECRICLQTQDEDQMISPCNCSGTMRYVHQKCLVMWLSSIVIKAKDKIFGSTAHIYCELCHGKIRFKVQKQRSCKNKSQIKSVIKQKKKTFLALILLIIANLAIFLTILAYVIGSNGFAANTGALLFPLMISGLVVFSIVVLAASFVFFNKFLLNQQLIILQILHRRNKQNIGDTAMKN